MDFATLIGLVLAWGALIGALVMEGGELKSLVNIPAGLLVFGGTIGAGIISFKAKQLKEVPGIIRQAFMEKDYEITDLIPSLVRLAERARREGLLTLEDEARRMDDEFLARGIRLVVDGTDPELVRDILTTDIHFLQTRHKTGETIFTTLGGFAPTLGIIGTVMGLIHMLANLSDPGKMGPLIAGAFIATLYGVSSANLIFLPIGNKLRQRSADEVFVREVMMEGILSIQSGDNPRIVEEKLKAFVAPRMREAMPSLTS